MKMIENILKNYKPIDYREWISGDKARKGANIKRLNLLKPQEIKIFNASIPYNDARNDAGQAELVTYFTIKLLDLTSKGNREVAVPSAILHDIGFYYDEPTAWKKLISSGKKIETEANRRPHQNRGLLLAGDILHAVNYPQKFYRDIADIIGDHDTRKLPATNSGKIVRAADYLWRVTLPNLNAYLPKAEPEQAFKKMGGALTKKHPFNLEKPALPIGRIELVNTMVYKFREQCHKLLINKGYKEELEIMKTSKFYSS